ncbi:hypothetical protein ACSBR2_022906 [Camellia fascicularis]
MVGCSGSHVVDVVVGDKRIVEVDDDNSCRIDSVICESSLVNDCDDFGGGVPAFRIALAKYAVKCGFAVNYLKNDVTRVTAEWHLLAATSKDGNQGLFPLAFAIVDAKNQDNWMWFLSQLLKAVGSGRRLTFVSNRQHGLLNALSVVFPNAHHAYCLNHLMRTLIDKLVGLLIEKKFVDSLKLAKSWDMIVASDTVLEESYKESVYPVPSSERFDFDGASSSIIKPPITKKQPGQNKKKMTPSRGENVKQIKCGRCLKYGNHNKKTCKAAI